jgi:hypothetical protein
MGKTLLPFSQLIEAERRRWAPFRRALYGIPDAMTHLFTSPQGPWEQVLLVWLQHHPERESRGGGAGEWITNDGLLV